MPEVSPGAIALRYNGLRSLAPFDHAILNQSKVDASADLLPQKSTIGATFELCQEVES
jgi:hypothetical protein